MLIAWINEDGFLNYTDRMEVVPEDYRDKVTVFENLVLEDAQWLKVENGEIRFVADENERVEMKKGWLIDHIKNTIWNMLLRTDWVIVKCIELGLDPKQAYPDVVARRSFLRQKCDELEAQIREASSLSDLDKIEDAIRNLTSDTGFLGFYRVVR